MSNKKFLELFSIKKYLFDIKILIQNCTLLSQNLDFVQKGNTVEMAIVLERLI